jgi:hypothetical protein
VRNRFLRQIQTFSPGVLCEGSARYSPTKPVGGFVVGVPTKDVRTFQTENPTVAIDGVFLKLVSAEELDELRRH